jgi:hypothetical protein
MSELTPVRRERIQGKITKIILQGDDRVKLDKLISVNELSGADAEEMIRIARKERVDMIRGKCMKSVYLGCLNLIGGIGAVYAFLMLIGRLTTPVWILSCLLLVLGAWKVTEGLVGIAMAPMRKGAVESD